MLSADSTTPQAAAQALYESDEEAGPAVGLAETLTWLGEKKKTIGLVTLAAAVISTAVAFLLPVEYTARATFLAPGTQQQSGSAAALAALGSLGAIAGVGAKTPDELYVALLKSDTVQRALAERFDLKAHYDVSSYEACARNCRATCASARTRRAA